MSKLEKLLEEWSDEERRIIVEFEKRQRRITRRMRWELALVIGIPIVAILASIIMHWIKK